MYNQDKNKSLEDLLKNVPGGLIMYRWDGKNLKTLAISEYYEKRYGESLVSSGENPGGPDFSRIHPDDVEEYRKAIVEALSGPHKMEYVYRTWNQNAGRYLWTKMNAVSRPQEDGTSLCYVMYSDVTNQQDAIEREKRITNCLELMTSDENFEDSLSVVMRLVEEQYLAERVYIFEFDWNKKLMNNTYECVAPGVSPEKDNLQDLPIDIVSHWLDKFREGESVFIDDLELIKDIPSRKAEYDILKAQNIASLMVVPITKKGNLYGYLGVDNPGFGKGDRDFLTGIAYILSQEFYAQEQQKKLVEMSLKDPLTKSNNRHSYNLEIESIIKEKKRNIGVIFVDINGLKYMNDNYGHLEGDLMICKAAQILKKHFDDRQVFRISGDEFVVLQSNIEQHDFVANVGHLKQQVAEVYGAIFSVGAIWSHVTENVNDLIKQAEDRMYIDKQNYYAQNPMKKRKTIENITDKM